MKQHPVHYLCDVHDALTDLKRHVFIGEKTSYSDVEVMSLLNGLSEIIINKEVEALEDYRHDTE